MHHGVDDHHGSGGRDGQIERQQSAQARRRQIDADAPGRLVVDATGVRGGRRLRQPHRQNQRGRGQEPDHGAAEQPVEADHRQQCGRERRAEQALQVVGEARERQGAGVVLLVGQNIRDGRLEGRREGRGRRLQQEDQDVDLPDLGHEGQQQRDRRPDEVHRDQKGAAGSRLAKPPTIGATPT